MYYQLSNPSSFHVDAYSNAALETKKETAGRSRFFRIRESGYIAHALSWTTRKFWRVVRKCATSKIFATLDICSHLRYFIHLLDKLFIPTKAKLKTHSPPACNLATSLKNTIDLLEKVDLSAPWEGFTSRTLRAIHWSFEYYHVVDAATEDNRVETAPLLYVPAFREK